MQVRDKWNQLVFVPMPVLNSREVTIGTLLSYISLLSGQLGDHGQGWQEGGLQHLQQVINLVIGFGF